MKLFETLLVCGTLLLSIGCGKKDEPAEQPQAQPLELTNVIPDGVLAYVATAGGENLAPLFEQSILGRIWNDPEVEALVETVAKQLMAKAKVRLETSGRTPDPNLAQQVRRSVLARPILAGIASKPAEEGLPVYGFAILDARGHKQQLAEALAMLEALVGKDKITELDIGAFKMHGPAVRTPVPVYWGWADEYLVLAVNDTAGLAVKRLGQGGAVAAGGLRQVPRKSDVFAVYADSQKLAAVLKIVAERQSASERLVPIAAALGKLGLQGVGAVGGSARFSGPDLVFSEFIEIPRPRTGLPASLGAIDLAMFDVVDARALTAGAFNCKTAAVYDTAIAAIKAGAPASFSERIDRGLTQLRSRLKFDIRQDLLANLAGPVVYYWVPSGAIVEAPTGGFVVVAEVTDAAAIEKALSALAQFAAGLAGDAVKLSSSPQSDGRTLHTCVVAPLAMMQVMPCWMIVDDRLLVASNPTIHKLALARLTGSGGKSIRQLDAFKQATAALPGGLVYLAYTDSQVQFKQTLLTIQGLWPMATMFAGKAGIELPPLLPSLDEVAEDIGPSVQYAWFDDQALRWRYRGWGIDPGLGVVAGGALGIGIAVPAVARTRQIARRVSSGTNLSEIAKACLIYANEHDDKLPPSLEALAEESYLAPESLESASKPRDFDGPSFIYVAGQTVEMDPGNIVAYENPAFLSDGTNVLYLDGHVQWIKPDEFLQDLEATYKRLGREMPKIKFKQSADRRSTDEPATEPQEMPL